MNETLLDATSPFEDMAEAALERDRKGVKESLAEAASGAAGVLKVLPATSAKTYELLMKSSQDAAMAMEHHAVAVNAVEMFRLLSESREQRTSRCLQFDDCRSETSRRTETLTDVKFRSPNRP